MGFKYFKVGLQLLAGASFNRLCNFHGHFYICFPAQSPGLFALRYLQRYGVVWLEWVLRLGRKWGSCPTHRPALLLSLPLVGPLWPAGFGVIALLADPKVTRPLQWIPLNILGLNATFLIGRKVQIPGRRKAVSLVSYAMPDHFVSQLFFAPQNIQGLWNEVHSFAWNILEMGFCAWTATYLSHSTPIH